MKALHTMDPDAPRVRKMNREKAARHRARRRLLLGDETFLARQREKHNELVSRKAAKQPISELLKDADFLSRFWSRVKIGHPDACWEGTGAKIPKGYGSLRFEYAQYGTHRIACTLAHGEIPEGLLACHHCDNPSCVNPRHLYPGTHQDNAQDCARRGRHARQRSA